MPVLDHLCLASWPFQVVPDERTSQIWADRRDVYRQVKLLLRGYTRSQASSINLLWADFGAGKTHFLRHLAHLAEQQGDSSILSYYSVFPKTVRSFVDLYRVLSRSWSPELLTTCYTELEKSNRLGRILLDRDVAEACRALLIRPELEAIVLDWLRAGRPLAKDLRSAGINQKIDSSERAIDIAVSVLRLITEAKGPSRIVWMIDEFQRMGMLKAQQRNDINIGLHSVFNELPIGFSLLLSFSFGEAKHIKYLLSEELLDRANMERYFQLPAFEVEDAYIFIIDLLAANRLPETSCEETAPFTEGTIRLLIRMLDEDPRLELKPRTMMQVFNAVLSEADPDIEEGAFKEIDEDFARRIFQERAVDILAEPDEE